MLTRLKLRTRRARVLSISRADDIHASKDEPGLDQTKYIYMQRSAAAVFVSTLTGENTRRLTG